ncbi:MAG: hypothetical protein L0G48_09870, partial [Staphylococcus equorum]|nr:hypothetical protein [Staphylococcus equorum]
MGKLYYMGFLSEPHNPNNFNKVAGSDIKMLYILDSLEKINAKPKIICLGMSNSNNLFKVIKNDELSYFYFATIKSRNFFKKIFFVFFFIKQNPPP